MTMKEGLISTPVVHMFDDAGFYNALLAQNDLFGDSHAIGIQHVMDE